MLRYKQNKTFWDMLLCENNPLWGGNGLPLCIGPSSHHLRVAWLNMWYSLHISYYLLAFGHHCCTKCKPSIETIYPSHFYLILWSQPSVLFRVLTFYECNTLCTVPPSHTVCSCSLVFACYIVCRSMLP